MILPDVNVLVYAHREESPNHFAYLRWLEGLINSSEDFGVCDLVLSGFIRIVTHPRIFAPPSTLNQALTFVDEIRSQANCVVIQPASHHWDIFCRLCKDAGAKGNIIPDAYFAALAIESGCTWITTSLDFSRFEGLTWQHPLEARI